MVKEDSWHFTTSRHRMELDFTRYSLQPLQETYIVSTLFDLIIKIANDTDYFIAKFNTKYNSTEWTRTSNEIGVNEIVRGLLYDNQTEIAFIAVEVDSNSYMGKGPYNQIYAHNAWKNQSNVALIAYDRYCKFILLDEKS